MPNKHKDPIDYNSALGISKFEWKKVLGANLALLLVTYTIALIFTLSGSDVFLLDFHSADLDRFETMLRGVGMYPIVQMGFSAVEMGIIASYIAKGKPKWWHIVSYFLLYLGLNVLLTQTLGFVPPVLANVLMVSFWAFGVFALNAWKPKEKWFIYLFRFAIALAISFILNGAIVLFRTKAAEVWNTDINNATFFALTIEYDLALGLSLAFLTAAIPWRKKGENEKCLMSQDVSGSSQPTMNSLPKNSKIAKNSFSPKFKKRLRLLKIKVIAIQTTALIVIAALPLFAGKPIEFSLVYASFCLTRLMLGFNRSLHFKSELVCITAGALVFWGLAFLVPSAEASIIVSLVYGCAVALGFRLYWELHDLIMYRKAAKTDRYAMLYVSFKTDANPRHVNGVMRAKGYTDKTDIAMVQMYMEKDKVEYIAECLNFAKITVEKRLTEIASDLYARR